MKTVLATLLTLVALTSAEARTATVDCAPSDGWNLIATLDNRFHQDDNWMGYNAVFGTEFESADLSDGEKDELFAIFGETLGEDRRELGITNKAEDCILIK